MKHSTNVLYVLLSLAAMLLSIPQLRGDIGTLKNEFEKILSKKVMSPDDCRRALIILKLVEKANKPTGERFRAALSSDWRKKKKLKKKFCL